MIKGVTSSSCSLAADAPEGDRPTSAMTTIIASSAGANRDTGRSPHQWNPIHQREYLSRASARDLATRLRRGSSGAEQPNAEGNGADRERDAAERDQDEQPVRMLRSGRSDGQKESEWHQDRRRDEGRPHDGLHRVGEVSSIDVEHAEERQDDEHAGMRVAGAPKVLANRIVEVPRCSSPY